MALCSQYVNFAIMLYLLSDELYFPPVTQALDDGLLALGGDLGAQRLLLAYSMGIFPWYSHDEPPLWWSPDPRFVIFPGELKVSKSMKQLLKRNAFDFRVNTSFETVIRNCMNAPRPGQDGTWISEDVVEAYTTLHHMGHAFSAEAWQDDELIGGLYGILMGKVFFGESMFSRRSNASKYAFIKWVQLLQEQGVQLIDCQVYTDHLESLGARMIPRATFVDMLDELILPHG